MWLKKAFYFFLSLTVIEAIVLVLIFSQKRVNSLPSPLPQATNELHSINQVLGENNFLPSPFPTLAKKSFNILLLGLDARRGDKNPRCDAIHIVSFNQVDKNIVITSIPRGTRVDIADIASESAYLGNSCHIKGIDFAVSEIEKISKIKPDYIVKLGFSQTIGILRSLNLPPSATLQYLRNRHFGLGDNQRTHNQALYLKDMFISHIEQVANLPQLVKYLLYQMIETNMPFETADSLLEQIKESGIDKNNDNIQLVIKPASYYKTREMHFDTKLASTYAQLKEDEEFQTYQNGFTSYLDNLIDRGNKLLTDKKYSAAYNLIKTPFSQQLWLQIEDGFDRNQLHFGLLQIYALSNMDKNASSLVLNFISEMEIAKEDELKVQAEELLSRLNGDF